MNHATLASVTAPTWKNSPRNAWLMQRPPRPGSTSPRLDKKKIVATTPGNQSFESSRTSPRRTHATLQVNQTNLSRSPSAPNLQATSMLALQSSLAGFTVLALGKDKQQNTQNRIKQKNVKIKKHEPKIKHKVQIHLEKAEDVTEAKDNKTTTSRSPLSPVRRLKAHIVLPTEDENQAYKETWIERQEDKCTVLTRDQGLMPNRVDTARQKLLLKETSV